MAQKICPVCGKTFFTRFNNQFCSAKCKHASDPNNSNLKICAYCGESFFTKHSNATFCSSNCRTKFFYQPKPVQEKSCIVCGKSFSTANPRLVCCSKPCTEQYERFPYKYKKRDSHEK